MTAFTVGPSSLGTTEAAWSAWAGLSSPPPMAWGRAQRVLVVAPHPDDEVLGVGGTAATLARTGAVVEVVLVTDGEASDVATDPAVLAARRRAETTEGLRRLGLGAAPVHRVGLPDGGVAGREDELTEQLCDLTTGADWCLAPWRADGHPDHEAAGRAAARACAATGARLAEYPVWAWHWATPGDDAVPWSDMARVDLPPDVVAAKTWAIAAFRSQLEGDLPVLPAPVLDRFRRPFEVLVAG